MLDTHYHNPKPHVAAASRAGDENDESGSSKYRVICRRLFRVYDPDDDDSIMLFTVAQSKSSTFTCQGHKEALCDVYSNHTCSMVDDRASLQHFFHLRITVVCWMSTWKASSASGEYIAAHSS